MNHGNDYTFIIFIFRIHLYNDSVPFDLPKSYFGSTAAGHPFKEGTIFLTEEPRNGYRAHNTEIFGFDFHFLYSLKEQSIQGNSKYLKSTISNSEIIELHFKSFKASDSFLLDRMSSSYTLSNDRYGITSECRHSIFPQERVDCIRNVAHDLDVVWKDEYWGYPTVLRWLATDELDKDDAKDIVETYIGDRIRDLLRLRESVCRSTMNSMHKAGWSV